MWVRVITVPGGLRVRLACNSSATSAPKELPGLAVVRIISMVRIIRIVSVIGVIRIVRAVEVIRVIKDC